ncbi:hypothetical protein DFP72DRAFT_811411, partial [Ephemerocybe angulata]
AGRDEQDSVEFRRFRQQLLHSSIARILLPLKKWMTKARLTKCGDGHWRRVVYGIGPYIADYPEQCLLACVVSEWCPRCPAEANDLDGSPDILVQRTHQHTEKVRAACGGNLREMWDGYGMLSDVVPFTVYFPRANIHELLSPDILHQLVKGTFKDHLVTWVVEWMEEQEGGKEKVAEMDRSRIAAVPHFPGLRCFHEGRGFKQWTGDDSKALMRVFLPAITGLVPDGMVRAIAAFLDVCYLVRRSQISESVLEKITDAVARFHAERHVFLEHGIRDNFNLPRQHSLVHYRLSIQLFGAPNGLCSSITESKHIAAVKETWRCSNRNQPLGQMLLSNQHLDKLAAARAIMEPHIPLHLRDPQDNRRTIQTTRAPPPAADELEEEDVTAKDESEPVGLVTSEGDVRLPRYTSARYPRPLPLLTAYLGGRIPLEEHIRRFLYDQLNPEADIIGMDVPLDRCPFVDPHLHVSVYTIATALYHAPSDYSGVGAMRREIIRATPSWQNGPPRHDCVYIERDPDEAGFNGLNVAQVRFFLSFKHRNREYQCAYVHWFEAFGEAPCDITGLWRVAPDTSGRAHRRMASIIHIDSILRSAHLIPVYGPRPIPKVHYSQSLQSFNLFYVNRYIDYHAHETVF